MAQIMAKPCTPLTTFPGQTPFHPLWLDSNGYADKCRQFFSQRCLPLYSTIHINNGVPACPIGIMRSKKSFQSRHEGLTPSDIFLGKGD